MGVGVDRRSTRSKDVHDGGPFFTGDAPAPTPEHLTAMSRDAHQDTAAHQLQPKGNSAMTAESTCVLWQGRIAPNGYGTLGSREYAHRRALAQKLGRPIAPGMDACHTCDVRACVNQGHLYEGTRRQNMADCTARGRHNKPRGEAHWCARLTASDVLEIRRLSQQGASRKDLGAQYDVHPSTISRIARGIWRQETAA